MSQILDQTALPFDIKQLVAKAVWNWFYDNQDDVIFEKKLLKFLSVKLKVRDLKFLFERLFGKDPYTV